MKSVTTPKESPSFSLLAHGASRICGAQVRQDSPFHDLSAVQAALLARLRADCWPFVGVRCLRLTLADGTRYSPSIVTADDGIVVCWEAVEGGASASDRCQLTQAAHALPDHHAVMFIVGHALKGGRWADEDVVPAKGTRTPLLATVPAELLAARPTIERMEGGPMTDRAFVRWCHEVECQSAGNVTGKE